MKIVFIGSGDIGLPALQWMAEKEGVEVVAVVTQPDKAVGRGLKTAISKIKSYALERHIPVLQPIRLRDPEAVKMIAAYDPDVLVVMAYGQILSQELLDIPKIGALNLHASLLPRHRGASPVHAVLLAGDRVTGVTVMWMDAGLDTGDILCSCEIAVSDEETAGSLHDRLAELAPLALEDALGLIEQGSAPHIPQDAAAATYSGKLDRGIGRVHWEASAESIARKVRALHPWPGSSTTFELSNNSRVEVKLHRVVEEEGEGKQGDIVDGLRICCGDGGIIRVLELQAAGGKRMLAEDFLRGHSVVRAVVETMSS